MKCFLCVIIFTLIVDCLSSKCDINEGNLMVMDNVNILKSPPPRVIIPLSKYQKNIYIAGLILSAQVTNLCKAFVDKFDDLQMLSFNDIPIESFDNNLFDGAPNIENLEFDGAKLKHIKSGIFRNVANLEELKFNNTPIDKVDVGAFDDLPKLEEFGISNSFLQKIDPAWFLDCPSIVNVDFSGNRIKTINTGDFSFMRAGVAHTINLSNNRIKTIASGAFISRKFDLLNLEDNRIRSLTTAIFKDLPKKSKKINLSTNRFTCVDEKTREVFRLFNEFVLSATNKSCHKSDSIKQIK